MIFLCMIQKNTRPIGYLGVYRAVWRQFRKPDILPATITICSSNIRPAWYRVRPGDLRPTAVSDVSKVILCLVAPSFEHSTLIVHAKLHHYSAITADTWVFIYYININSICTEKRMLTTPVRQLLIRMLSIIIITTQNVIYKRN
jgi:hypothetical protein